MAIDFRLRQNSRICGDRAMTSRRTCSHRWFPDADATRDPHEAFAKTKPAYVESYKLWGSPWDSFPRSTVAAASATSTPAGAEEICAVDPASRRRSWSMVWAS